MQGQQEEKGRCAQGLKQNHRWIKFINPRNARKLRTGKRKLPKKMFFLTSFSITINAKNCVFPKPQITHQQQRQRLDARCQIYSRIKNKGFEISENYQ